jgi:hypothetical protein
MSDNERIVRAVYPNAEIREIASGVYRVFSEPSGFRHESAFNFGVGIGVGASVFSETKDKWECAANSINFKMMRKLLS